MVERLLQLARHSAVYGIGSVASKVLAILLLPIYVRVLSTVDYGAVETILVLDLLLAALVKLGLQNSMMRFYFDEERAGRGRNVTSMVIWVTGLLALLATLAMVGFADELAARLLGDGADELMHGGRLLVMIGAAHLTSTVLYGSLVATFRLEHRPLAFTVVSLANVLLTAGFTLVLLLVVGWRAEGLLLGNMLGTAVLIPVLVVLQWRFVRPSFDRGLLGQMLRYGVPLMPVALSMQGLRVVDRLLLNHRFVPAGEGLAAVGLYSVGVRFSQVVILVITALQLSWQPFAYAIRDDDEARRTYAAVMAAYLGLVGWIVASVSMLADPLVRLVTVPEFYDAASVVPLLSLAAMFFGAYFIAAIGAGRAKRTNYNLLVALAAFVVSVNLNWFLIPHWGVMGAGAAAVGANLALAVGMLIRSQQVFPIPYLWRRNLVALAATITFVGCSYLLPTGTAAGVLLGIGASISFPLVLMALGWARPGEVRSGIAALRQRRRRTPPPTETEPTDEQDPDRDR